MFLGLVAVMAVPSMGEGNFGAVGYDCSNPTNIKVYNTRARCQHEQKILQIVNTKKTQRL